MRKSSKIVGTSLLVGIMAACGTPAAQQPAAPAQLESPARIALESVPTTPTRGLAAGLSLPLQSYSANTREQYAWQIATQGEWRNCMAKYGFKGFAPPAPSIEAMSGAADTGMGRRYGISDLESAKKRGYHLPEAPEPPRWEPAKGAETAVFTGTGPEIISGSYAGQKVPTGGCREEANRRFPFPHTPEVVSAEGRAFSESQKDTEVVKAVEQWSACMKESGIQIKTPLDDLSALGVSLDTPKPTTREVEIAVTDVECKKKTNLISIWHKREDSSQKAELATQASKLEKERQNKNNITSKASEAVNSRG